mmetsp:Transcript_92820/g.155851  ORF Transcript_92820/g.155851 Transcript_92820/m.155851 type:complete len:113 (-) Transcript_92820:810-1148(-)
MHCWTTDPLGAQIQTTSKRWMTTPCKCAAKSWKLKHARHLSPSCQKSPCTRHLCAALSEGPRKQRGRWLEGQMGKCLPLHSLTGFGNDELVHNLGPTVLAFWNPSAGSTPHI